MAKDTTGTAPLRPSSLLVEDHDGTKRLLQAEKYDDLMWLYMTLTREKKYKRVEFLYCSGQTLKLQLVIGLRYVGETVKGTVHYEDRAAKEFHERLFTEQ